MALHRPFSGHRARFARVLLAAWVIVLLGIFDCAGGGSGLNTVIVINQASSNSCQLGNYYCEQRQVPPENVLRINWAGGPVSWTLLEFQTNLLNPLLQMLADRELNRQVEFVVLSMDIPFQTVSGSACNGTTSVLFYGFRQASDALDSDYAASEGIFRSVKPAGPPGFSFLSTMLTAGSLQAAKRVVDQGVSSDGTFPLAPVLLEKTTDSARNVRHSFFDNAIFNVRLAGANAPVRIASDDLPVAGPLEGLQTGLPQFTLGTNMFSPGAIADNMTSFGGIIFGPNTQTSLLAFLDAGAAGSYGTVTEPYSDPSKFPKPDVYFYQARGFSLAESYYQGLDVPCLGLVVAEPLASPFARSGLAKWSPLAETPLSGTVPLSVRFSAASPERPLQQADLFVDGKFYQTLTNAVPAAGNLLTVTVNGCPFSWTVPPGATLQTCATSLVAMLNRPENQALSGVSAAAHGDRIELRSSSLLLSNPPFFVADSAATSLPVRFYRVRYLPRIVAPELLTLGRNRSGALQTRFETSPGIPYTVWAGTNLVDWEPVWTNTAGGVWVLSEPGNLPVRFYRATATPGEPRPVLSLRADAVPGTLIVHAETGGTDPYVLQVSSNLLQWSCLATNVSGGSVDFVDSQAGEQEARFYRAQVVPEQPPPALLSASLRQDGAALVRVDNAAAPYVVEVSSDAQSWLPVTTNREPASLHLSVSSTPGSAETLSTFLFASRPDFLSSDACGLRRVYLDGTAATGSWLELLVTKTNGVPVRVAVTNQAFGGGLLALAQQAVTAINNTPEFQDPGGIVAEDMQTDPFGAPSFELRARSGGAAAAALKFRVTSSAGLWVSPWMTATLTQNLADLQPRNHVYVTAGAGRLAVDFSFDTTRLTDGFHELTAVGYEGTHVRTQTRATVPITVRNGSLCAELTSPDLFERVPASGTYHLQVTANATNTSAIRLFSTGGWLGTVTNQAQAEFQVEGASLGVGRHPFFALVETADGLRYRTTNLWTRLVNDGP